MGIGKLYIVPTPIGNLKDISLRALEVIKTADVIAAEDTRQTLKLLNHFEIKKPLISYHKFNEEVKSDDIISKLRNGENIALVTDAGTPGISDPGSVIIKRCIKEEIEFEVLTGASALITALVYSGLNTESFTFKGFLPREEKEKKEVLNELKDRRETLIFYEAPHRLTKTLGSLYETFGERKISICRELTKLYEEIKRTTISEALEYYSSKNPRGEFVIVVAGKSLEELLEESRQKWEDLSVEEHILMYMSEGIEKKDAIKKVAKDRNLPKTEIYRYSHNI